MTPFAFDTLNASKRLREAGMEEGVSEAVAPVFQHAAGMPDISHLATKDDVNALGLHLGQRHLPLIVSLRRVFDAKTIESERQSL